MSHRLHLGVLFTGVGPQLIWTDPAFDNHTHIDTFVRTAQTLERGLFDAFFLGEGLRVRENRGRVHDLDVAGRPDAITQLAALAAVTDRIGLVATQNTTYNFPADLARRLASLDAVSGGRAGWNIVTTDNAWTGENFRYGGWLPHERRYERANAFVETAKALWSGTPVDRHDDLIDVTAAPTVPARPVLFQAGDSAGGRDLAARHADVVFSANTDYDKAQAYATDLRQRLASYGRGQIADEWTRYVRDRAVDGFNILPQLLPGTIEDIVDKLVPELQERGVYRTAYEGTTLREHLDLPA